MKGILHIILSLRSSIYRRYYVYLRPEYVKEQLRLRKGDCKDCGGKCCIMTRKCPYVDENGYCKIYKTSMPKFCMVFPIDETDIKLAGMEKYCQFYWEK